jgi:hypothetical protein
MKARLDPLGPIAPNRKKTNPDDGADDNLDEQQIIIIPPEAAAAIPVQEKKVQPKSP